MQDFCLWGRILCVAGNINSTPQMAKQIEYMNRNATYVCMHAHTGIYVHTRDIFYMPSYTACIRRK